MAKKQQIILLHGSTQFNDASQIAKGELVVEHGKGVENVKIHTLDDENKIATFITDAAVDNKLSGLNETVFGDGNEKKGLVDIVGDDEKGLVADVAVLQEALGLSDGPTGGSITTRVSDLEEALNGKTNEDGEVIEKGLIDIVGNSEGGLVADVAEIKGYTVNGKKISTEGGVVLDGSDLEFAFNEEGVDAVYSATTVEDALKNLILADIEFEGELEAAKAAATTEVKADEDVNNQITVTSSEDKEDGHKVYTLSVTGLLEEQKFIDFLGDDYDEEKPTTAREIVKSEIDKQLDPDGLTEAFDTLTTVAEYIKNHEEEVSGTTGILARITNTEDILSGFGEEGEPETVMAAIQGLSTDMTNTITGLTMETVGGEGKFISAISQKDGLVSATATTIYAEDVKRNVAEGDTLTSETVEGALKELESEIGGVSNRVGALEEMKIVDGAGAEFTFTPDTKTINLSTMTIDCGTY